MPLSITFLEASFFPHLPYSPMSFSGESLDHIGRMTMGPSLEAPSWKLCCGGYLLSLKSFCFCACLCSHRQHRLGCIGRCLADALPPCSGGCFATIVVLVIVSGGCFATLVDWVDDLPPLSCCRSLHPWRCSSFLQVLVVGVFRFAESPVSPPFFLFVFQVACHLLGGGSVSTLIAYVY